MPGRVNRIAYVDLNGRVCTINPDGTQLRRLSEAGLFFQHPAWSPDSRHVAAIGVSNVGAGVYTFSDTTRPFSSVPARPREIYFGQVQAPIYLYWSPQSDHISFLVSYPQSFALYLADIERPECQLLETGQPFFWDWTPDGAYMLIHTDGSGETGRLNFIDTDGEDWGENLIAPGSFQSPAISTDGRLWAYAGEAIVDESEIIVEHAMSGDRMTVAHRGAAALAWQPGGHLLAFTCPDDGAQHFFGPLHLLDADTERTWTAVEETVFAYYWAPDGRKLAYFTLGQPPAEGARVALDAWVYDLDRRDICRLLTFQPPVIFLEQFLPFFDQFSRSHRLWSPRSDALVLPSLNDQTVQVLVVPADGSEPRTVAEGFMASWSPG